MTEQICKDCQHNRRGHSKDGCMHRYINGQYCTCTTKYMDRDRFEEGTARND